MLHRLNALHTLNMLNSTLNMLHTLNMLMLNSQLTIHCIIINNRLEICILISWKISFFGDKLTMANVYKSGAMHFNAGCNNQMFSPKPRKKFSKKSVKKNTKSVPLIPINDVIELKARLFLLPVKKLLIG